MNLDTETQILKGASKILLRYSCKSFPYAMHADAIAKVQFSCTESPSHSLHKMIHEKNLMNVAVSPLCSWICKYGKQFLKGRIKSLKWISITHASHRTDLQQRCKQLDNLICSSHFVEVELFKLQLFFYHRFMQLLQQLKKKSASVWSSCA